VTLPPPDPTGADDERERAAREEALWQSIVANYGARPDIHEQAPVPASPGPHHEDPQEAHYVPPEPPPVTLPKGPRLVAWAGVFVVPLIGIVLAVLQWAPPSEAILGLLCWFIGGCGYRVWQMPKAPEDGWDDGARL